MFRPLRILAIIVFAALVSAIAQQWKAAPPLPQPVSNNTLASVIESDGYLIYSFMGIGPSKIPASVTRIGWVYNSRTRAWTNLTPVPGTRGRLAASSIAIHRQIFIFGGYVVAEDGKESTSNSVDIFTPIKDDPAIGYWTRGVNIPVPVDDAVIGIYRERFIYLISGWSNTGNVNNVQIYDTFKNSWRQGTPIPGTPVFGHAGSVNGDRIVYCGGAYKNPAFNGPKYLVSRTCWEGKISGSNRRKITWKELPAHPGDAHYRMAAGAFKEKIIFAGGTANPYNFDGIGYDAAPSEPSASAFSWDLKRRQWERLPSLPVASMDHRNLVRNKIAVFLVGGMTAGQKVTNQVQMLELAGPQR